MRRLAGVAAVVTFIIIGLLSPALAGKQPVQRVSLDGALVLVDSDEASYVQYAARDLTGYLSEVSGRPIQLSSSVDSARKAKLVIAIGKSMALAMGAHLQSAGQLGREGAVIRSFQRARQEIVIVAGTDPHGTNLGVATLLQMIHSEAQSPYLEGPLDLRSQPSIAVRGLHLNGGWQLNHPYGFRTWTEEDWKHFVDLVWAERGNLIFIWPYVETMTVPLSSADKAYLEEFRRITDYAQKQRGMEVWIMQSANRVAISDCNVTDPRLRPHWINGCQKDMDPTDPKQFANIEKSFKALYQVVNNADAFCLIDSDPGGWPQSPVGDQVRIFRAARKLLDRYNVHGLQTKLVDWMWIGWGRHKFFTSTDRLVTGFDWTAKNPDQSDVAFMRETIREFKANLPGPWELVAGMAPYLEASRQEGVLDKTIFLPYGAIEMEPAFPGTNMGFDSLNEVFEKSTKYQDLRGWLGNNELLLLQFPRSYYFLNSLWDANFKRSSEKEALHEISRQLYPAYQEVITDSFLGLREKDTSKIISTLSRLQKLIDGEGRPGAIGRFLFPDSLIVARDLKMQLEVRLARQRLITALQGMRNTEECARLVEDYFDQLLAWNKQTGWDKTIDIAIWTSPIYEGGKDLSQAMSRLKQILGEGAPYTDYAQVDSFFERIGKDLMKKYGQNSVMIGCVEPFKLAVIQTQ